MLAISQPLRPAGRATRQVERGLQLLGLARVDEADLVGEDRRSPSFWMRSPTDRGGSARGRPCEPTRAKMPKRPSRACTPRTSCSLIMSSPTSVERSRARDVASAWKRLRRYARHDRQRRREQVRGNLHVHAAGPQAPTGRRSVKDVSVEPGTPAVEVWSCGLRPGAHGCARPGTTASRASVTQASSASVTVMDSMVSDRFVPSYCPTNPSACSHPASAASANIAGTSISASPNDDRRCHSSVSPARSSPAWTNRPVALAGAPPHQVVGGHVEGVPGLGADPQHLLGAVALWWPATVVMPCAS